MADARRFFDEFVCPSLAEFAADTSNLRRAFIAVQMVDAAIRPEARIQPRSPAVAPHSQNSPPRSAPGRWYASAAGRE